MRVMEYIREHREDENPFECVILPDGSVDAPVSELYTRYSFSAGTKYEEGRHQICVEDGEKYGAVVFHGGVYGMYARLGNKGGRTVPSNERAERNAGASI